MSGSGRETGRYGGERDGDDLGTRLRENATGIASLLVTGLWLAAMFTDQEWWLAALLVGYIVVVPLVAVLFGDEADREEWLDDWMTDSSAATDSESGADRSDTEPSETDRRDALETLRDRYAAGELTDEQFERKLERLLGTETLEDADEWVRERSGDDSRDRERERGRERERDRNREYDR